MVERADGICVVGSKRDVRVRLDKVACRELPFQKLTPAVEALLARREAGTPLTELTAELNVLRGMADACDRAVDELIGRLEKTGVSTALVYDIERLRAQVQRLELLLEAWAAPALRDTPIAKGDKVVMVYTSANRDEDVFDDPHRFDIHRNPNPHLSFGIAEHFCLGVHLARLEGRVFFEELLAATSSIEQTGEARRQRSNLNNALKSLPVRLTAA